MVELQRLLVGCGDDNYIDKAYSTNCEHVWSFHIVDYYSRYSRKKCSINILTITLFFHHILSILYEKNGFVQIFKNLTR